MKESAPSKPTEINERLSALITNTSAIRAITGAVEGTIGPRGLDTMLVDRSGDIIITNDGVTILDRMDVSHPAARMLINIARAQHEEIGDGTTTAVIMAGTLISEGLNQIMKGVPVTRIIEGIRLGINKAVAELKSRSIPLKFPGDPLIERTAFIAGRGNEDIARMATGAISMLGYEKVIDPVFKARDMVIGVEGAENDVFTGIIIKKRPVNEAMPGRVKNPVILCLDDSLDMEKPQEGSLNTESGYQRYMKSQEEFLRNVRQLTNMGLGVIFIERGISGQAEAILTEAGIMVVTRLTSRQMKHTCAHIGATPLKLSMLSRPAEELKKYLGGSEEVIRDQKLKNIRITGGKGQPTATLIVGAPTPEVLEERERIACDAISSVQAALKGGVVAGGGAAELGITHKLLEFRSSVRSIASFGIDCVIEALRKPISQIIQNAGFNPLEKVEEILSSQKNSGNYNLALDCDTGEITDMLENRIVDPAPVKIHALKAAGEVAEAILRINIIIKMKDIQGFDASYSGSI